MTTHQPAEFVVLWSEHSRAVYAYIYALVFNANDADDIFQETSLTLFQKFAEFEPGTNFASWACAIARYKVLQFLERRRLSKHVDEQLLSVIEEGARRASTIGEPRLAALRQCLAKLTTNDRQLIQLRYERGASVKSVAEKVGRSAPTVYRTLSRLYDALLECIRRRLEEGNV